MSEHSNLFAFNVEPRDISAGDLSRRPQALPRYDCNQFPHGDARLGDNLRVCPGMTIPCARNP
jgi:hypothetical protein